MSIRPRLCPVGRRESDYWFVLPTVAGHRYEHQGVIVARKFECREALPVGGGGSEFRHDFFSYRDDARRMLSVSTHQIGRVVDHSDHRSENFAVEALGEFDAFPILA